MLSLPHKNAALYQHSLQLTAEVYKITQQFSDGERVVSGYALRRCTTQLTVDVVLVLTASKKNYRRAIMHAWQNCITLDAYFEMITAAQLAPEPALQTANNLLLGIFTILQSLQQLQAKPL